MSKKIRRRKKRIRLLSLSFILVAGILVLLSFAAKGINKNKEVLGDKEEGTVSEAEEPKKLETKNNITVNIKATGDIMFHPSQLEGAYNSSTGTYDFRNSFRAVKKILQDTDVAIGNFEGTTAGNQVYDYQGYPIFNAPDEVLDAIKDAGFNILSTANNHCLDTGKTGVIRTVQEINARGMESVGTYVKKPETRVLIKDVKGIKIAFLSYTEMVNGLETTMSPEDLDAMVNIIDEKKIMEDIAYSKEKNADIIIACLHWGDEYSRVQAERQELLADKLFASDVDIILGNHPHVIQPAQTKEYNGKTKFVVYSMGNFLSNQRVETLAPYGMMEEVSKYTEDGVIVDINIEKNSQSGEVSIKDASYIPLWVYKGKTKDGRTEHVVYPIMEYIESNDLDDSVKLRMQRSLNDTTEQMKLLKNNMAE